MNPKQTGRMALAGVLTALALVVLLLTVSPLATVGLAAVAALCGIPVVVELGRKAGLLHFAAVAVLAAILVPTIEGKGMYVAFFGWYTVYKAWVESLNLPRPAEWAVKIGAGLAATAAYGAVWIFLLHMPLPQWVSLWMFPLLAVGMGVLFVVYDVGLTRVIGTYVTHIRPSLGKAFRF